VPGAEFLAPWRTVEQAKQMNGPHAQRPHTAESHTRLANRLRQLGRADEALAHYRYAAELAPNDPRTQGDLGQMLLALHRPEEAIGPCERAANLQPHNPILHLILGDALRRAEWFPEAEAAYRTALRLRPTLAPAHAGLGLLFRAQKRIHEVFAPLQQAVALGPNNVFFWTYLAEAHADWGDFLEAANCWRRALALQPDRAESLQGLGNALREAGSDVEAEQYLRAALARAPGLAAAHLGLGAWHEQRGEVDEAAAAYRAAVTCQPSFAPAHARLADLLRGRLPEPDRRALEQQLVCPQLPTDDRALLLFAQAGLLEQGGDHRGAAGCVREAHALALQSQRGREYTPEGHRLFVDRLMAAMQGDFFRRAAGAGDATRRPVFIVGLPRSGTTLVEQVLASHPQVHAGGELMLAWQSFVAIPAALNRADDPLACLSALDAPAIRHLARRHLAKLDALDGGRAARITDKLPENYLYLGLLAALFPNAHFVHCRRDLRDVAVSCWMTHLRWVEWTHDQRHIAAHFREYVRLMAHWQRILPVPLHEVDYEEMVRDLEGTARKLVAACGLDWHPACLEFHRTRRPVRTASATQVHKPLYSTSVGRWRRYEQELAELIAACESLRGA
jgi:tetratricopeptide (TPR) repeat protein